MKLKNITMYTFLATASLIVGCGDTEETASTNAQVVTTPSVVQRSAQLNKEVNGYQGNVTLAESFTSKKQQTLSDLLFMYLLDDKQKYVPGIAYGTYKELGLGTLSLEAFNEAFVVAFSAYAKNSTSANDNLVSQIVEGMKNQEVHLSSMRNATARNSRAVEAKYPISADLLSNTFYNVFSEEREFTLDINEAISLASAKAGFFSLDVTLQLVDNFLYTSSSQGDLKMWLEYPARGDNSGRCLCVHSEDSNGNDVGLSYYFTKDLGVKSLADAESKCQAYPPIEVAIAAPVCREEISYLRNSTTGICTEFHNSCDAVNSGWSESCTIADVTSSESSDLIVIGDVEGETINEALIAAYSVALESDTLSVDLIDLANEHSELASVLLDAMKSGAFNSSMVPHLSQNRAMGESFLKLMKGDASISDYVFENLDAVSYSALMKSLMFSREASLTFSEVLKDHPEYLAEGSDLSKLILNVNTTHGDASDNANEMLFTAMFSSSSAANNMLDAVEGDLKYRYLDFIFLGILGDDATVYETQQYYNLSSVAEGMVVGIETESLYRTKLVFKFFTSIAPSKYLAYGKALYSAGTDYLAKVDPENLERFKNALSISVAKSDNGTTLSEGNSSNSAEELHGIQYDTEVEAVQASIDTTVSAEQVTPLNDYETTKKATDTTGESIFTFIPSILSTGSEVIPTADEDVLSVTANSDTTSSFFFLAPIGTTPDVGVEVEEVAGEQVQSSTTTYNIFTPTSGFGFFASSREARSVKTFTINRTSDIHMIVVPR